VCRPSLLESVVCPDGEIQLAGGPAVIARVVKVITPGLLAAQRCGVAEGVDVGSVQAAHHARPARSAYRTAGIRISKVDSHGGDPVHVRRLDDSMAVA